MPRFRQSATENMDNDYTSNNNGITSLESSDNNYGSIHPRKQVVKMKRQQPSMRVALDKALQSTQFEGLKILTRETILKAFQYMDGRGNKKRNSVDDSSSLVVPSLKL